MPDSNPAPRRTFLTGWRTALASIAAVSTLARAEDKLAAPWKATTHDVDAWLGNNQAKHRVVFDTTDTENLGEALFFASNFINTNRTAYNIPATDLSVVIIVRHRTAIFGYNDAIWAKYGEAIAKRSHFEDPKTKSAPKTNLFNAAGYSDQLPNHGVTLNDATKLGVQFAVCQLSTRAAAAVAANAAGLKAADVLEEISANLIPNARLVPAGIVTMNRAQEYGYTLMSI
jgi:intracellular sulfur oxidation DsrE/DsrF family protein